MQQPSPLFKALATSGLRIKKKSTVPVSKPAAKPIPFKVPANMMATLIQAGQDAAYAYFNGNSGALESIIADARSSSEKTATFGLVASLSGIKTLADLLGTVQANGLAKIAPAPPTGSLICYQAALSADVFWAGANTVLQSTDKLRQAMPGIKVSIGQSKAQGEDKPAGDKKTQENTSPQKVEIVGMPPQQPIEVRLVSMPGRESIVTVERDDLNEIARTIHTERDA